MSKPDINASAAHRYRPAGALLSTRNMKTFKGEGKGWLTAILYLAPHTLVSPKTLCPFSTPACREACLYSAGRGAFPRTMGARIRRTEKYLLDRPAFMARLWTEIAHLERIAQEEGLKLAVRLNGTSDILWEREPVTTTTGWEPINIMRRFPAVTFYDYTKIPLAHRGPLPPNYSLVFSMADDNHALAWEYLGQGQSVSVVVTAAHKAEMLATHERQRQFFPGGYGFHIIDGDEDDLRFLDDSERGTLILLSPKGRKVWGTALLRENPIRDLLNAAPPGYLAPLSISDRTA